LPRRLLIDLVSGSWILISFKREFPFEDVLRLWEVLWTDYYMNGMVLFVALAVLESHRDVMLRYLVEFDEILKVRVLSLPRLFVSKGWIPGLKWPCGPVSIATS
jgi:Rab-GTPase-TBC domain